MRDTNKALGGLYGALIGDACGVPYEFKAPGALPAYDLIDMTPPESFKRTWANIPVGTYSDDGAQILCHLDVLLQPAIVMDGSALLKNLRCWLFEGFMSVDNNTFDVGNQTGAALRAASVEPLNKECFNGNGSLMRTLPVALAFDDPCMIAVMAYKHSAVTHPHPRSCMCCVLYSLTAHYMLEGNSIVDAIDLAVNYAVSWVSDPIDREELDYIRNYEHTESTGTGYVVDSLWSAYRAVWRTNTFSEAIKTAIAYGNDTDTTACIAGGLAGIRYGLNMLPSDWLFKLKGREIIDPIADRLAK